MRLAQPGFDGLVALVPRRFGDDRGFFRESWNRRVMAKEGQRKTVEWYLANEAWWRALQGRHGVGQRLGVTA